MGTTNLVKDALAKTLREMLETRAIDKITVEEIAEKSGLSKRTFYNHFRDKHDLVAFIWQSAYESCWTENGRFLSCEEFLVKYHKLEDSKLQNFFRNTLPYTGQNNLWETIDRISVEYTKMQMRHNGFTGEFDSDIMNAIYFWVNGTNGNSRNLFNDVFKKHVPRTLRTPEERAKRELALIPAKLRPWLLPHE